MLYEKRLSGTPLQRTQLTAEYFGYMTRASRLSWALAAPSRSAPPTSPAATCGTTSPPSSGKPQRT